MKNWSSFDIHKGHRNGGFGKLGKGWQRLEAVGFVNRPACYRLEHARSEFVWACGRNDYGYVIGRQGSLNVLINAEGDRRMGVDKICVLIKDTFNFFFCLFVVETSGKEIFLNLFKGFAVNGVFPRLLQILHPAADRFGVMAA